MIQDSIENIYSLLFENLSNKKIIIGLLILYIIIGYKFLPSPFFTFMNNPIGRFILLISVLYLFSKDNILGLLSLIAFWITISSQSNDDINEHFNSCVDGNCQDQEDDDEDDEENTEAFYAPDNSQNQELQDHFTQIHNTVHRLEAMLRK